MELRECYTNMKADYDNVMARLRSEERIKKYLFHFLEDMNYQEMESALDTAGYTEAFLTAHNLKGLCLNLSLTQLASSASNLCEALRGGNIPSVEELIILRKQVEDDYKMTSEAIHKLKEAGN